MEREPQTLLLAWALAALNAAVTLPATGIRSAAMLTRTTRLPRPSDIKAQGCRHSSGTDGNDG